MSKEKKKRRPTAGAEKATAARTGGRAVGSREGGAGAGRLRRTPAGRTKAGRARRAPTAGRDGGRQMETTQQQQPQPGAPPPFGAEGDQRDALRERVERAAAATGVEGEQVERLPFDLSILDRGGIFINVDTEGFGILDQRLKWDVLGIKLPKETTFSFRAPRMGVLPETYRLALQRPAHRAHTVLAKHSFR